MNTGEVGDPATIAKAVHHMLLCGERSVFIRPNLLLVALPSTATGQLPLLFSSVSSLEHDDSSMIQNDTLINTTLTASLNQVVGPVSSALEKPPSKRKENNKTNNTNTNTTTNTRQHGATTPTRKTKTPTKQQPMSRGIKRAPNERATPSSRVVCLTATDSIASCIPLAAATMQRQLGRGMEHALATSVLREGLSILHHVASPLVAFSVRVNTKGHLETECAMLPMCPYSWRDIPVMHELLSAPQSVLLDMLGDEAAYWLQPLAQAEQRSQRRNAQQGSNTARWATFQGALRRVVPDHEHDLNTCCRTFAAILIALELRFVDDDFLRPATSRDAEGLDALATLLGRGGGASAGSSESRDAGLRLLEDLKTGKCPLKYGLSTGAQNEGVALRQISSLPQELYRFICEWFLESINKKLETVKVQPNPASGPHTGPPVIIATCIHSGDVVTEETGGRGAKKSALASSVRGGRSSANTTAATNGTHHLDRHFFSQQIAAGSSRSVSAASSIDEDYASHNALKVQGSVSVRHLLGNIAAEMVYATCGEALEVPAITSSCEAIPFLAQYGHRRAVELLVVNPAPSTATIQPPLTPDVYKKKNMRSLSVEEGRILAFRADLASKSETGAVTTSSGHAIAPEAFVRLQHGFGEVWYRAEPIALSHTTPTATHEDNAMDHPIVEPSPEPYMPSPPRRRGAESHRGGSNALIDVFYGSVDPHHHVEAEDHHNKNPSQFHDAASILMSTGGMDGPKQAEEVAVIEDDEFKELNRMLHLAARHVGCVMQPLLESSTVPLFVHIVPTEGATQGAPGITADPEALNASLKVSVVGGVLAADAAPRVTHRTTFDEFTKTYFPLLAPHDVERMRSQQVHELHGLSDKAFLNSLCQALRLPRGSYVLETTTPYEVGTDQGGGTVGLTALGVSHLQKLIDAREAAARVQTTHKDPSILLPRSDDASTPVDVPHEGHGVDQERQWRQGMSSPERHRIPKKTNTKHSAGGQDLKLSHTPGKHFVASQLVRSGHVPSGGGNDMEDSTFRHHHYPVKVEAPPPQEKENDPAIPPWRQRESLAEKVRLNKTSHQRIVKRATEQHTAQGELDKATAMRKRALGGGSTPTRTTNPTTPTRKAPPSRQAPPPPVSSIYSDISSTMELSPIVGSRGAAAQKRSSATTPTRRGGSKKSSDDFNFSSWQGMLHTMNVAH